LVLVKQLFAIGSIVNVLSYYGNIYKDQVYNVILLNILPPITLFFIDLFATNGESFTQTIDQNIGGILIMAIVEYIGEYNAITYLIDLFKNRGFNNNNNTANIQERDIKLITISNYIKEYITTLPSIPPDTHHLSTESRAIADFSYQVATTLKTYYI
jgi:hypothetical protein